MDTQLLMISKQCSVLSDPEWIALESIEERTSRFIFEDDMLVILARRGLVESDGEGWRVTQHGQQKLSGRN